MVESPLTPSVTARNWATACHLLGLCVFFGVPFGNILGPLVLYLVKKDEDPFIAFAGREALNFQIFVSICGVVLLATFFAAFFTAIVALFNTQFKAGPPLFVFLLPLIFIVLLLFEIFNIIVAAMQTSLGKAYRYPITLRFIR